MKAMCFGGYKEWNNVTFQWRNRVTDSLNFSAVANPSYQQHYHVNCDELWRMTNLMWGTVGVVKESMAIRLIHPLNFHSGWYELLLLWRWYFAKFCVWSWPGTIMRQPMWQPIRKGNPSSRVREEWYRVRLWIYLQVKRTNQWWVEWVLSLLINRLTPRISKLFKLGAKGVPYLLRNISPERVTERT